MHSCQNSLGKPYTEKRTKHTPSGYSLLTNCSFDVTKNKLGCYKGEDCMKGLCKGLRDHAVKIINYEEKEIAPLWKAKSFSHMQRKISFDENDKNAFKLYHESSSSIVVITLEDLEELLIVFAI